MRVLGIDTATWTASIGLLDGDDVVADVTAPAARSHVGHLPALVERVLAEAALGPDAIEAVAVSSGPGSFTGLRIGVAFAKGLAFAGRLPVVAVPTLEAIAVAADLPRGTPVCSALDARKGEVYAAIFEAAGGWHVVRRSPDMVCRPPQLVARLTPATVVIGDGAPFLAAAGHDGASAPAAGATPAATGSAVARLGARRLAAGEHEALGPFEPTYVRQADARLPARPLR